MPSWHRLTPAASERVRETELRVRIDVPGLWEPDAPRLYIAELDLETGEDHVDRTTTSFGSARSRRSTVRSS